MKTKQKAVLGTVLIVLAGLAVGSYFLTQGNADSSSDTEPAEVRTVQPVEGSVRIGVDAFAVVEPIESRVVRSRNSGVVTFIVPAGTVVSEGAEIARLDTEDLESRLARAELDISEAELSYDRTTRSLDAARRELSDTQSLFDAGVATGEQLAAREESLYQAEYAQQSASISLQRRLLDYESVRAEYEARTLRAPLSGVVTDTQVAEGDNIGTNAEIMTISDTSRVRLVADIDEYDIGRVALEMRAQARIDALEWMEAGLGSANGVVDSVSPSARIVNNISVFTISARFNNTDGLLRPGMTADLSVLTAAESGLVVPSVAVSTVRERTYVDVVLEDGTREPRRVEAGLSDGVQTVIHEGIGPEDRIAIPDAGALEALSASTLAPPEQGQSLIPVSVPGTAPSGGGGGGGGRQ